MATAQTGHRCGALLSTGRADGETATCPACGETRTVRSTGPGKYTFDYWTACACIRDRDAEQARSKAESDAYQKRTAQDRLAKELGLFRVKDFRLDSFDRNRLRADSQGSHPYDYVVRWLETIRGTDVGNYHSGPPPALYLYSQGKGRGKTHLASAIAWHAYDWGYLASFIEETSYLSQYWAGEFDSRDRLQTLIGDRCWLTVIDDLGQTIPAKKDGTSGASKAWYDITNRRWLKRGWTVITSNRTLEELVTQGTLNEASYSRVYQMTRGQMVIFDGADYRLGDM